MDGWYRDTVGLDRPPHSMGGPEMTSQLSAGIYGGGGVGAEGAVAIEQECGRSRSLSHSPHHAPRAPWFPSHMSTCTFFRFESRPHETLRALIQSVISDT